MEYRDVELLVVEREVIGVYLDREFLAIGAPVAALEAQAPALFQRLPMCIPIGLPGARRDLGHREAHCFACVEGQRLACGVVQVDQTTIGVCPVHTDADMVDGVLGEREPVLDALALGDVRGDATNAVDLALLVEERKLGDQEVLDGVSGRWLFVDGHRGTAGKDFAVGESGRCGEVLGKQLVVEFADDLSPWPVDQTLVTAVDQYVPAEWILDVDDFRCVVDDCLQPGLVGLYGFQQLGVASEQVLQPVAFGRDLCDEWAGRQACQCDAQQSQCEHRQGRYDSLAPRCREKHVVLRLEQDQPVGVAQCAEGQQ